MQPTASNILKEWQKLAEEAPKVWFLSCFLVFIMLIFSLNLLKNILFDNHEGITKLHMVKHQRLSVADLAYGIIADSSNLHSHIDTSAMFSQFKLQGILFDTNNNSHVIISYHGSEDSYQVGDYLPNKVQVFAIRTDAVVLKYDTLEYVLEIAHDNLQFLPISQPLTVTNTRNKP